LDPSDLEGAAMSKDNLLPKIRFDKILYVTDLSESGRHAFPYAASIAHQYEADLTVYHVVETDVLEKQLIGYIDERMWGVLKKQSLDEAREMLIGRKRSDTAIKNSIEEICQDVLSEEEQPYVSYEVVVEPGDPVERILHKAHGEAYDLVVIARRGHGAFSGALIGDTAQRVVRRCRKPVMVVEVPVEAGD
jgi:nucleotide-binding universal stress UspA family protein